VSYQYQKLSRSRIRPADPHTLASAVAGALVTSVDDDAKAANIWYWHRAQPLFKAVTEQVAACPDDRLRLAAQVLLRAPGDPAAYRRLHGLVVAALDESPESVGPVVDAAWDVLTRSRLGHHLGPDYRPRSGLSMARLAARSDCGRPGPVGDDPDVLVVIPFRDRGEDGHRARNLLACLLALRDQTLPRERYRVTVVESDSEPRWRDTMSQYADEYLFAEKAGPFNKCWTVNVGVQHSAGQAEVICLLDADHMVDADFLTRNLTRFQRPETGAFLPYRDVIYLDAAASAWAIDERCGRRLSTVDWSGLRGFLVHRAPGGCVWLRRDIFDGIGGLDERYEGWGKEDMDLLLRLQLATAFYYFDDLMLHLHHPPSFQLTGNAEIPWLSWMPDAPIGRLDRFAGVPER
jgi:Glycosyl transferase family 2